MAKSFKMFTWYMQLCKRYYGEDYQWRALQEGGKYLYKLCKGSK